MNVERNWKYSGKSDNIVKCEAKIFGVKMANNEHEDDKLHKLELQRLVDGKSDRLTFVESKGNTCLSYIICTLKYWQL